MSRQNRVTVSNRSVNISFVNILDHKNFKKSWKRFKNLLMVSTFVKGVIFVLQNVLFLFVHYFLLDNWLQLINQSALQPIIKFWPPQADSASSSFKCRSPPISNTKQLPWVLLNIFEWVLSSLSAQSFKEFLLEFHELPSWQVSAPIVWWACSFL